MKTILQRARVRADRRLQTALCMLLMILPAAAGPWSIETVDQIGPGKSSSLQIDKFGNIDVAYVVDDGNRNPLRYATWDHNAKKWFVMTLAEGAGTCALVLDSKQNPHVSYVDAGSGSGAKLRYIYWDGSAWKKVPIQLNSDIIAYYTSLVLDANDNPSISFYEYRGPKDSDFKIRLRNVTYRNGYWQLETIDSEEGSGKFNAMAIDRFGHVHISYANVSADTAGARYAYWNGSTWQTEIADGMAENNGQMVGYSSSIVVDKAGNPHISYANESTPMLKYAVRKDGKWHVETVTGMSGVGYPDRNSIALDSHDQPYISYFDAGRGTLNLAHRGPKGWVLQTVDGNGSGFTSSMQIANGQIWIGYADETNGGLKVAHRDLEDSDKPETSALVPQPSAATSAKLAK